MAPPDNAGIALSVELRGEGATFSLKAMRANWRDIAQRSEYAHIQNATWASPARGVASPPWAFPP
jgi:hypothetical protein